MKIKKLYKKAVVPYYATIGSAGLDLSICINTDTIVLYPNKTELVGTGFAFEIPKGYVGLIYIRSSVGAKQGIVLANGTGVIDSDYRGEIMLPLKNTTDTPIVLNNGSRVAQIVITPILITNVDITSSLKDTERGVGGFGSTGGVL